MLYKDQKKKQTDQNKRRMTMTEKQAIEQAKTLLKDFAKEYLTKTDPQGRHVCPFCGSGTHENKTSAFSIKGNTWRCFSCGEHGDIYDLAKKIIGITDTQQAFSWVFDHYKIKVDGNKEETFLQAQGTKETQEAPKLLKRYFEELVNNRPKSDYLTHRGISQEVQDRFNIGYEENYTTGTGGKVWQAVIIPTSDYSYTARNTDVTASKDDRLRKYGPSAIFNVSALKTATKPIFVVEGEIDALSVIETGADAVALGGINNFTTLLKAVKETTPQAPLILSLDQDEPGRKAENKLAQELDALRVQYYRRNISGSHNDPNEALMEQRSEFIQTVSKYQNIEQLEYEEKQPERDYYYSQTCAKAFLKAFKNNINDTTVQAIETGFKQLDDVLDGGLYEGLYICGAISSLGKTTFVLQMADQIAQSEQDVLIFSLEMARNELISKSVSRLTYLKSYDDTIAKTARGITTGARHAYYRTEEIELIHSAFEAYEQYANHIYIVEGVGDIGVQEVRKQVEKHIDLTGRKPVVIVDYVQILAPYNERATDKQNTDKNVVELKRLSRDYKIPVIGISSFNRASYSESASMSAFKESGAIEYSADVLLALQYEGTGEKDFDLDTAKKKDSRDIELKILKNRNGRAGEKISFEYHPKFNCYFES